MKRPNGPGGKARRATAAVAVALTALVAGVAMPTTAPAPASADTQPRNFAYVVGNSEGTVSVIDPTAGVPSVIHTISTGGSPRGVAIAPDGRRAYVTSGSPGAVWVIDPTAEVPSVIHTISVSGSPKAVAVTPDGKQVYVTRAAMGTVSVIDATAEPPVLTHTITVGGRPRALAISPDGRQVYVVGDEGENDPNTYTGTLSVIDATADQPSVIHTLTVGDHPRGVAFTVDGSRAYVANAGHAGSDSVSVIDSSGKQPSVVATIPLSGRPNGVAITSSGTRAYVVLPQADTVAKIDTTTNEVMRTIEVGDSPSAVAITDDGTRVYVTNQESGSVSVIDAKTRGVTTVPGVGDPAGVAIGASGQSAIVSLGDSFISGVAGRWRGNGANGNEQGDNWGTDRAVLDCNTDHTKCKQDPYRVYSSDDQGCLRADSAEILAASADVTRRINLACSGAETKHLMPTAAGGAWWKGHAPQADQLRYHALRNKVKMVVVSIGGNDMGFRSIITACITGFMTFRYCHNRQQPLLDQGIQQTKPKVDAVIGQVRQVMADAGYADDSYRLVLQSYPNPVPPGKENRYPETYYSRYYLGGCPVYNADSDWIDNTVVPGIAQMLKSVAHDRGIDFLDVQGLFAGHEVCSVHAKQSDSGDRSLGGSSSEWARFLDYFETQGGYVDESVHPNFFGQKALGTCLTKVYSQAGSERSHTCTGEAGHSPKDVTVKSADWAAAP